MSQLIFCERFHTSYHISPTNFKTAANSCRIVGFFKFVSEIQQLVQKRLQKND